jgi:dihydrolipoamide dehydrogenase
VDEFDVVVVGGGPTGENLAERAHAGGLSVAVVEAELVGGECSYWACMPSKALLRPAAALADARRLPGTREAVTGELDAAAVLGRRDSFASHWKDDGQVAWLDQVGITLVRGHGRLDGEKRVVVDTPGGGQRTLTARHAVALCTGTRAALPDLPGLAGARPWTSREATSASAVPGRLAVVGGGVVATEMATAWRALGSEVVLLVRGQRLLPRMEEFAGELVARSLRESGVDVRFGVSVGAVHREGDGQVRLGLGDAGELTADEVLFATGRVPATAGLGLETVGLDAGKPVEVDDTGLAVGVPGGWLYAAGDVNGRVLMTHQGKYQGRIFGAVIADRAAGRPLDTAPWGRSVTTADERAVPQVVFTDPEVAAVGPTLEEARRRGHRAGRSTTTWAASPGPPCTRTATGDAPARWWTRSAAPCSVSPSPVPASPNCCTRRPSPWPGRSRSTGSGMPCPRTRRSARSGCACWRPTGADGRAVRAA